mmetsp:Transcript_80685/g.261505  ORF Transcript_80685/g.261505 Transcript_80685/m.261505 type:complete len:240 (-) Transcript_80685:733-1452(-)
MLPPLLQSNDGGGGNCKGCAAASVRKRCWPGVAGGETFCRKPVIGDASTLGPRASRGCSAGTSEGDACMAGAPAQCGGFGVTTIGTIGVAAGVPAETRRGEGWRPEPSLGWGAASFCHWIAFWTGSIRHTCVMLATFDGWPGVIPTSATTGLPSGSPRTQAVRKTCSNGMRSFGSICSNRCTRSLTGGVTSAGNLRSIARILAISVTCCVLWNGGRPTTISYNKTPKLQMSRVWLCPLA